MQFVLKVSVLYIAMIVIPSVVINAKAEPKKMQMDSTYKSMKIAPFGSLKSIYTYGPYSLSGQIDQKTIPLLKKQGYNVVINIRAKKEVKFNEKSLVEAQGIKYYNEQFLFDGQITEESIKKINAIAYKHRGDKVLIHCSSGNRVAAWVATNLVELGQLPNKDAVKFARQIGMTKKKMAKKVKSYLKIK